MFYFCSEKRDLSTFWWRNASDLKSDELKSLTASLPSVVEAAFSNSTNTKYSRGWRNWLAWASKNQEVNPVPADPFYVALYLNSILQNNGTKGALTDSFYGIRWGHHISGLFSPTDHPFLQVVFEGCKRSSNNKPRQKKDPITSDMIKEWVNAYGDEENLPKLRFLLICVLGFTGFMRIDEILKVQLKHLKFTVSHLEITLEKSKTDQLREGNIIYISKLDSKYCPVKILKRFMSLAKFDIHRDVNAFLICRLHKTNKGHSASRELGIAYSRAREIFKEHISQFDTEGRNFGLHSLRSGGASAAAQNGVSDRLISKHGRWVSESGRNGYIKDSASFRNKVSRSLGL